MEKRYDVGIYGLWYGRNYGSIITYYALDNVVKSLGYSTAMIKNPLGREGMDLTKLTRSHSLIFADKHYNITPLMEIDKMSGLNKICDRFLLGSDQMWNYHLSRPYKQTYFFDFVEDSKIKAAYATSFGRERYLGPDEEKVVTKRNLERFDAISVRDDFSKEICEKDFGIPAEIHLDPVFLCPKEKYEELISSVDLEISEPFIFAYILDPNPEIGKSLKQIAEESGKKMVVIFNEGGDRERLREALNAEGENMVFLMDATVEEWLFCFQNSDFVITDSFHGCCFSVIFEKNFAVKKNMGRGGRRFDFLVNTLGLQEYMTTAPEGFVELFKKYGNDYRVDYGEVKEILKKGRMESITWLEEALKGERQKRVLPSKAVVFKLDIKNCTGCSACVNACPTDALKLEADELGYYRTVIREEKCIDCGKCARICPAIKLPENRNTKRPECYAFTAADEKVLDSSSSGGIFPILAEENFAVGGIIVGAAWRDDYSVEHILIDKAEDLPKLQKSKYLQSYLGTTFKQIKEKLDADIPVLFSGCPCQVTGLKAYLGKDYDKLLLVDLLCSNAPSAMFFKKYIEDAFPEGLKKYEFRHKVQGWRADCVTVTVTVTDGTNIVRRGGRQDDYQRVYHNHTMCPYHCEKCKYQELPRFGDLSIGDFWGIEKRDISLYSEKGVSVILCNNEKGRKFLEKIPEETIGMMKKVPLEWLGGNGFAINNHNYCSSKRDDFYKAVKTMPFSKAVDYALRPNHGIYEERYEHTNALLQYDTAMLHFKFDSAVWEEHNVNHRTVLIVKPERAGIGRYAVLPLCRKLEKGREYRFHVRFKVRTESKRLNFHIKDSGSTYNQVIYSYKVPDNKGSQAWVEISIQFVPDSDIYDEFMIGASQISGDGRYIAFDYIYISSC